MGEHIRLRGTLLTVCMYACMHVHVHCMPACMCSECMHVLCMHPGHALEGYSAVLVPYIGVRETRTGYVPLGLVDHFGDLNFTSGLEFHFGDLDFTSGT